MRRASLFVSVFAVMLFGFIASGRTALTAAQDATPMADSQGFVGLVADGQGTLFGTATFRASVTLDPDGKTFSGSNMVKIADLEGTTVATRRGTIQGMRIVAEQPEMTDAATPAA